MKIILKENILYKILIINFKTFYLYALNVKSIFQKTPYYFFLLLLYASLQNLKLKFNNLASLSLFIKTILIFFSFIIKEFL